MYYIVSISIICFNDFRPYDQFRIKEFFVCTSYDYSE